MFGLEKIKELDKIAKLEEKVAYLTKMLDKAIDMRNVHIKEIDKLHRILKHHGNNPSCELNWSYSWMCMANEAPKLFMYIDCEEYVIELPELNLAGINRDSINFWMDSEKGGFAHFDIRNDGWECIHRFTIDYKKGTYLYQRVEESEVKECLDLEELKN